MDVMIYMFLVTFGMNKARKKFMSLVLESMILTGVCNLSKLTQNISNNKSFSTNYKRMQRFIASCCIKSEDYANAVVRLFPKEKYVLCLDRTVWKSGSDWINILVLAIQVGSICIPIFNLQIEHRGASKQDLRMELISKFIDQFGSKKIDYILGDREFVGRSWLNFLNKKGIKFCIRLRRTMHVHDKDGKTYKIQDLADRLIANGTHTSNKCYMLSGVMVKLYAALTPDNDYIVVAINHRYANDGLELYATRWSIEIMFKKFKTGGFNIEDINVKGNDRVGQMFLLCSIALLLSVKIGEIEKCSNESPVKVINQQYPRKSVFLYGLTKLKEYIRGYNVLGTINKTIQIILEKVNSTIDLKRYPDIFRLCHKVKCGVTDFSYNLEWS